jgi:hypothetical protein
MMIFLYSRKFFIRNLSNVCYCYGVILSYESRATRISGQYVFQYRRTIETQKSSLNSWTETEHSWTKTIMSYCWNWSTQKGFSWKIALYEQNNWLCFRITLSWGFPNRSFQLWGGRFLYRWLTQLFRPKVTFWRFWNLILGKGRLWQRLWFWFIWVIGQARFWAFVQTGGC